jgi:uncharacterized phiE125 gp8 family phage protein
MSDQLLVAPVAEPIHLAEAKAHLRVTIADEDALISSLITAARTHVEIYCGRALVRQQRVLTLDEFPCVLELPVAPVRAVQSIQYVDTAGATQTLSADDYRVDRASPRARIQPAYGEYWPTYREIFNAITVKYTAGYAVPISAFDAELDVITAAGHDLSADDPVQLTNSGGGLQSGLSVLTNYYVKSPTTDTLQLAASAGGSAVDITTTTPRTGQSFIGEIPGPVKSAMLLIIGHLFEHREENSDFEVFQMPMNVCSLLAPYRMLKF